MARPPIVRPAAVLVAAIVLLVVSRFSGDSVAQPARDQTNAPVVIATVDTAMIPAVIVASPTDEPSPTMLPTWTPTPLPTTVPTPSPTERPPAIQVTDPSIAVDIPQGTSGRKEVALSFDAGEGTGYTAQILDLLKQKNVKATFGVTGEWAQANPDLMRRIVADGHMIINHTYDHKSFTGVSTGLTPLTDAQQMQEVEKTEQIIKQETGYETRPYFRFPYGDYDLQALKNIAAAGYPVSVRWTCDTEAWNGFTVEHIIQLCGHDKAQPGEIILSHVAQENDYKALPGLIDALQAQGYTFVTIDKLLQP